jgi:raffinose/stachyose/melibiose transport system permease protein
MKKYEIIEKTIKILLGWAFTIIIMVPFLLVLFNSLKTENEALTMSFSIPSTPHWINYYNVFVEKNVLRSLMNSSIISLGTVIPCSILSAMAAFIFARRKNKLNSIIYNLIFMGMIAPVNYVTTVKVMSVFHISNTYYGIILFYIALGIPFATFLYNGFIGSIPKELDEAGIIDGCGITKLFFSVIFPLMKPVTVTVMVLTFISAWNDFISPLYLLNKSSMWGMIIAVYGYYGAYTNRWEMISTVIIITLIPLLIIYILSQKYIIAGMTAGAVKG